MIALFLLILVGMCFSFFCFGVAYGLSIAQK